MPSAAIHAQAAGLETSSPRPATATATKYTAGATAARLHPDEGAGKQQEAEVDEQIARRDKPGRRYTSAMQSDREPAGQSHRDDRQCQVEPSPPSWPALNRSAGDVRTGALATTSRGARYIESALLVRLRHLNGCM